MADTYSKIVREGEYLQKLALDAHEKIKDFPIDHQIDAVVILRQIYLGKIQIEKLAETPISTQKLYTFLKKENPSLDNQTLLDITGELERIVSLSLEDS